MTEPAPVEAPPTEVTPANPEPETSPDTTPVEPAPAETPAGTPQEAPEPATEDEPAGEPEEGEPVEPELPAGSVSEKELEKASRSLERSVQTYTSAVERYLAITQEKVWRDPLSDDKFPGYFYSPDDVPLDESQQAALRLLLGMELLPNLKADPLSHRCDTCDGRGQTDTTSQVQGERYVTCPVCDGHGFVGERLERMKRAGHSVAATSTTATVEPGLYAPPMDTWGTPLGHPGFGTPPDKWLVEWFDVPGAAHSHVTTNSAA
jgi:hypothetical protein